jgi:hypothetical protein
MFTPEQIENFKAYEQVRQLGEWNMFDPKARQSAGLNVSEFTFVMKNYVDLARESNKTA